jgi:hypothetical protein
MSIEIESPRRRAGRPYGSKSRLRTYPDLEQWIAESGLHSQRVLSFKRWCQFNDISVATGRRILASGSGPEVVRITDKRLGITVAADAAWKAARVHKQP